MSSEASTTQTEYQLKRNRRNKNIRIRVTSQDVLVTAPRSAKLALIDRFVQSKKQWIQAAQRKLQQQESNIKSFAPANYYDDAWVPYRGMRLCLTFHTDRQASTPCRLISSRELAVYLPESLSDERNTWIRRTLIEWMKLAANQTATATVQRHSSRYRLVPRSVKIKTLSSRWGSCGIHDDIHINWVLILAPAHVLEYVVVHELCHLRYRNHSAEFWQLVAEHLPDYQESRQWLKDHGRSLMLGL